MEYTLSNIVSRFINVQIYILTNFQTVVVAHARFASVTSIIRYRS